MTVLTRKEAAEYLKLGEQAFNKRVREGKIPSIQLSPKRRIFTRESLDQWLEGVRSGGSHESVIG